MANFQIAVVNNYSPLSDSQVQEVVDALQVQVHRDFAPAWGIDADLTYYADQTQVPATSWVLGIFDNSDQAGALGYHDMTAQGQPLGKVFAGTDAQYGNSWSVTASHELMEILGDPDINLTVFRQQQDGSGVLYAYENCDACEADQFGYMINNVLVSDFVYPAWFEEFHLPGEQFDYGNQITSPFQILAGGYIGIYNITAGNGWTQLTADNIPLTYQMRAHVGSRRERRRTPRSQWLWSSFRKNR
ncbi:hypothetical protein ACX0G9_11540 [Flavitalea flava]